MIGTINIIKVFDDKETAIKGCFKTVSRDEAWMICTETPEECELWVSEIKKTKGIKTVEKKRWRWWYSNLAICNSSFTCTWL